VAVAGIQLLVMFGGPVVAPDASLPVGMIGGIVGALLIVLWWLLFSRARWFERVGAIALIVVALFATRSVAHVSMVGAGQGFLIYVLPIPYYALALVAWALATRSLQGGARLASMAAAMLLVAAPFAMIRTDGVSSAAKQFHWRWTPTAEERLLAEARDEPFDLAQGRPKPIPPVAATASESVPIKAEEPAPAPAAPAAWISRVRRALATACSRSDSPP